MARPTSLHLALSVSCASCFFSGCAQFDFRSHESFDSWYVAREDGVQVDQLGVASLDGNVLGFLLNDVAIRTPLALLQETTYLAVTPVALPYYWVRSATRPERPAPAEAAAPDDAGEAADAASSDPDAATPPDAPADVEPGSSVGGPVEGSAESP